MYTRIKRNIKTKQLHFRSQKKSQKKERKLISKTTGECIQTRAEINEIKTRKKMRNDDETKNWLLKG